MCVFEQNRVYRALEKLLIAMVFIKLSDCSTIKQFTLVIKKLGEIEFDVFDRSNMKNEI